MWNYSIGNTGAEVKKCIMIVRILQVSVTEKRYCLHRGIFRRTRGGVAVTFAQSSLHWRIPQDQCPGGRTGVSGEGDGVGAVKGLARGPFPANAVWVTEIRREGKSARKARQDRVIFVPAGAYLPDRQADCPESVSFSGGSQKGWHGDPADTDKQGEDDRHKRLSGVRQEQIFFNKRPASSSGKEGGEGSLQSEQLVTYPRIRFLFQCPSPADPSGRSTFDILWADRDCPEVR